MGVWGREGARGWSEEVMMRRRVGAGYWKEGTEDGRDGTREGWGREGQGDGVRKQ